MSVSPALVESDSMNMVLSEDQKAITIPRYGFLMACCDVVWPRREVIYVDV